MKKSPYTKIRNSKGQFTKNINYLKIVLLTTIISLISMTLYSAIDYKLKEIDYNNCYAQYNGANFISCDTDDYFVYRAQDAIVIVPLKATTSLKTASKARVISNNDVNAILFKYFPENAEIVKAVLTHESQLKINAISYNCFYKDGIVYTERVKGAKSTFCKKGHIEHAWSVDCGVAMLNYHQKTCPAYTMELEPSIKKMRAMYEKRGLQPWVSYNSEAYKQYLTVK